MKFESEDYDDYDDSESDRVEAEDINIDEYLSATTLIIKPNEQLQQMTTKNANLHWQHPLVFIRISSIS
jgi:hypothetical protein